MGMHILENEYLKVMVADAGAELSSVYDKETDTERLWDADPAVWNRHAPILFPFVGRVIGGVYRIGEKEYTMKTQHGFARDKEFECVAATQYFVTHRLVSTEETKEIYPYDFELFVTHSLDAENPRVLKIDWEPAYDATRCLAKSEGYLVGITSGASLYGATLISNKYGFKNIVALLPDTGERYLSSDLF